MTAPGLPVWLPITEVLGLPLHPLVVHAAVVFLPLSATGLVVMASGSGRSKRYGGLVVLVAVAAALSAYIAMASGRELSRSLGYGAQRHFDLGAWLPWAGIAVFAAALLLWLADKRSAKRNGLGKVIALLSYPLALVVIGLTVWTGHLGAELTWGSR